MVAMKPITKIDNFGDLCTGCRIILEQILEKCVTAWIGLKLLSE